MLLEKNTMNCINFELIPGKNSAAKYLWKSFKRIKKETRFSSSNATQFSETVEWSQCYLELSIRSLFQLVTPGLTCKLFNPFYDWLERTSSINQPVSCIIRGLTQELKIW